MISWLWAAGAVQVAVVVVNFFLPKELDLRQNLVRVSPMIREMFVVHWAYIVLVLAGFASLCFWFAPELAGASRLGRFLSGFMAGFWLLRVPLQLFFYDPEIRRRHRWADVSCLLAFSYLGIVFSAAALGVLQ